MIKTLFSLNSESMGSRFARFALTTLILPLCLTTVGCGGPGDDDSDNGGSQPSSAGSGQTESSSEEYTLSYDFSYNGCRTGKHTFNGDDEDAVLDEYCEALLNDELNNFCARILREQQHKIACQ